MADETYRLRPLWLARHNKAVFGTLYVAGIIVALVRWSRAGS